MTRPTPWSGRLAAGPWWLLYSGAIAPHPAHTHRAMQIVVHGGSPCFTVADVTREGPIVVVHPDERHGIHQHRGDALVLFIAPDSDVARVLGRVGGTSHGSLLDAHPVAQILGSLHTANWSQSDEAVRRILDHLGVAEPCETVRWWRHPAVDDALVRLPDHVDERTVDVCDLADQVGLSADRLAAAFATELGLPLGSFVHWLRLVRAAELLVQGMDDTTAARAAGFVDGAALSTELRSMFGLSPEELLRLGT